MGEQTAVASAKRAVRGDFRDGALFDDPLEESSDEARGRAAMVICFGRDFSWLLDISSETKALECDLSAAL